MRNYTKSCIYILVNNFDTEKRMVYIGTTSNWSVRKYQHKRRCNDSTDKGHNSKIYRYIRKFGGWNNWNMIKLEDYPCDNSVDLLERERYYIHYYNAKLNTQK
tara:strand:- start:4507 stop:4815 length:309 start_codon:yes stop_codon:yes gene_type:complete